VIEAGEIDLRYNLASEEVEKKIGQSSMSFLTLPCITTKHDARF
jgi:hypothetical protein